MLIGRSDDPHNPCRVAASKVSHPFGGGSRSPSGPAARAAQTEPALARAGAGHTTATAPAGSSRLTPCIQGPSTHALPRCPVQLVDPLGDRRAQPGGHPAGGSEFYIDDFVLMLIIILASSPLLLLVRIPRRQPVTATADD
jgi:hypothetical protein